MRDTIKVEGIRAHGFHGVFEQERQQGQTFVVDFELETSFGEAIASDQLQDTLDYAQLAGQVVEIVQGEPVNLIETLCDRVLCMLLEHKNVLGARVTIHKPEAPMEVSCVGVSVSMYREAQ